MGAHSKSSRKLVKTGVVGALIVGAASAAIGLASPAAADWDPAGPNKFSPSMPSLFPEPNWAPYAATSGAKATALSAQGTIR